MKDISNSNYKVVKKLEVHLEGYNTSSIANAFSVHFVCLKTRPIFYKINIGLILK